MQYMESICVKLNIARQKVTKPVFQKMNYIDCRKHYVKIFLMHVPSSRRMARGKPPNQIRLELIFIMLQKVRYVAKAKL